MRFSLRSMLLFTTAAAMGFAAIKSRSEACAIAVASLMLAAILFAIVAAIFQSPRKRPFWVGFITFSLTYFLLVCEIVTIHGKLLFNEEIVSKLASSKALLPIFFAIQPESEAELVLQRQVPLGESVGIGETWLGSEDRLMIAFPENQVWTPSRFVV